MRVYYGMDGLREHIDSSNLGIHTRDQGGVYASFDARALKRFSFNVGVREELYTAGRQEFSPSVSGAYWVSGRVKLRASASHGFRLPDYTELYYSDPVHLGNPNLKPETSWSYEGGVQLGLGRGITVDAGVFTHRDQDVIDYARNAAAASANPETLYLAQNIQRLNFTGAELSLRWQLRAAAAHRVELYGNPRRGGDAAGLAISVRVQLSLQRGSGDLVEQAAGRRRFALPPGGRAEIRRSDAYPLVEWTVARQFEHLKPYLQLTNLTNTNYQEIAGVAMPGRGFIAGMEVRWKAK